MLVYVVSVQILVLFVTQFATSCLPYGAWSDNSSVTEICLQLPSISGRHRIPNLKLLCALLTRAPTCPDSVQRIDATGITKNVFINRSEEEIYLYTPDSLKTL